MELEPFLRRLEVAGGDSMTTCLHLNSVLLAAPNHPRSEKRPHPSTRRKRLATYFHKGIPPRKAYLPRIRDPITQWYKAIPYHCSHCRYEFRRVLIVRVYHDNDIGTSIQRQSVAGLLIGPVPLVVLMYLNSNCGGDLWPRQRYHLD
jgi:hypothetical protein